MKVISTVEARMAASCLPEKVMRELMGKPVLHRVVERISQAKFVEEAITRETIRPPLTIQDIEEMVEAFHKVLYYREQIPEIVKEKGK